MVSIIENVTEMVDLFGNVATFGPASAVLLAIGALLIIGSSAVLGYLTAGAFVDLLIPESLGRSPPQQG
ncbi:hypothetical protein [Halostella pelagica]|uniref:hypothetical protein n=1 Tax=Halostella pelagica TaxID=2583824 RepID=UPI0010804408|nr:hypothetical protein [Halostella pelagica]